MGGRVGGMTGGTMGTSETKDGTSSPATATQAKPVPVYEPPAVAWEEVFDPVAQSCSINPSGPGCGGGGGD